MNQTQTEILEIITKEWNKHPELRFGQLLTVLNILEFANKANPDQSNYQLRDIFADTDKNILKRLKTT